MFEEADIISVYTADQAVEDGILVEVPEEIRRAYNIVARVFVTTNLYRSHVEVRPLSSLIDERSATTLTRLRMAQLVRAAALVFRAGDPEDLMRTNITYRDGTVVWGVIDGAGVTLMLPEDY
jgi:hypothetical protein